jgi:hypothetical protein
MDFTLLLMRGRYVLPMIVAVVVLVLGIIITCIKVKETRFLGLSVIFAGLSSIVSSVHNFLFFYMGSDTAARLNRTIPYYVLLLTLTGYFFICFYVHRNYHKKFLYIPMMAIPVAGNLITIGATRLVNMLFYQYGDDINWSFRTSLVNYLFSLIISAAILILLYCVFKSNRKLEKYVPHYHTICLITLIWNCIYYGFYILYNASMLLMTNTWYDPSFIIKTLQSRAYVIIGLNTMLNALVSLILPIYILIRVIKASHAAVEKEAAPEI